MKNKFINTVIWIALMGFLVLLAISGYIKLMASDTGLIYSSTKDSVGVFNAIFSLSLFFSIACGLFLFIYNSWKRFPTWWRKICWIGKYIIRLLTPLTKNKNLRRILLLLPLFYIFFGVLSVFYGIYPVFKVADFPFLYLFSGIKGIIIGIVIIALGYFLINKKNYCHIISLCVLYISLLFCMINLPHSAFFADRYSWSFNFNFYGLIAIWAVTILGIVFFIASVIYVYNQFMKDKDLKTRIVYVGLLLLLIGNLIFTEYSSYSYNQAIAGAVRFPKFFYFTKKNFISASIRFHAASNNVLLPYSEFRISGNFGINGTSHISGSSFGIYVDDDGNLIKIEHYFSRM